LAILFTTITLAQTTAYEGYKGAVKAGLIYVHDFPGLNGAGLFAEFVAPFSDWIHGGVGIKRLETSGYPRTTMVKEFTKATTIDFTIYLVPVHTERHSLKVGLGYTSSQYNAKRSTPAYNTDKNGVNIASNTNWQPFIEKGRSGGMQFTGEYEYFFYNNLSTGVRIQYAKGYQYLVNGGPFVSYRF
jgi:hypothetical protein